MDIKVKKSIPEINIGFLTMMTCIRTVADRLKPAMLVNTKLVHPRALARLVPQSSMYTLKTSAVIYAKNVQNNK